MVEIKPPKKVHKMQVFMEALQTILKKKKKYFLSGGTHLKMKQMVEIKPRQPPKKVHKLLIQSVH